MRVRKRLGAALLVVCMVAAMLTGCGSTESKRIIRIGHNQSTNHPTHIGLTAFAKYINAELGDKYVVEGLMSRKKQFVPQMLKAIQQEAPSVTSMIYEYYESDGDLILSKEFK